MHLITYNLKFGGKGKQHWSKLLIKYDPAVLLVQESYSPAEHIPQADAKRAIWQQAETIDKTMPWGSGVYFSTDLPSSIDLPAYPGWVVGAEVAKFSRPGGSQVRLRAFSVHAPTGMGTYQKVVNRILDMLLDDRDGGEVVIGGDFNLTVSRRHPSEDRKTSTADLKIQDRLQEQFGLINCWQEANPDTPLAQTLRWGNDPTGPYHCDGLYVPASWRRHLDTCEVLTDESWGPSDHNPVVAEFS